jgi:hypothetical protein
MEEEATGPTGVVVCAADAAESIGTVGVDVAGAVGVDVTGAVGVGVSAALFSAGVLEVLEIESLLPRSSSTHVLMLAVNSFRLNSKNLRAFHTNVLKCFMTAI